MSTSAMLWKELCCTPAPYSQAAAGAFSSEVSSPNWALHFASFLLPTLLEGKHTEQENHSFLYTHTHWILQEHWKKCSFWLSKVGRVGWKSLSQCLKPYQDFCPSRAELNQELKFKYFSLSSPFLYFSPFPFPPRYKVNLENKGK